MVMVMVMVKIVDIKIQVFAEAVRGVEQNSLEPNFSSLASAHKECTVSMVVVIVMMMVLLMMMMMVMMVNSLASAHKECTVSCGGLLVILIKMMMMRIDGDINIFQYMSQYINININVIRKWGGQRKQTMLNVWFSSPAFS